MDEMYVGGEYLQRHPTWHTDDSPWKAEQIVRLLQRNRQAPSSVAEVGCGAGEILRQLQLQMSPDCSFCGYEISPQAIEMCQTRANERLSFKLGDVTGDRSAHYDLLLVMDVLEHVEDCFAFLRGLRSISDYKVFHVPLDISVQTVLRGRPFQSVRDELGHLHYFTKDTALRVLKDAGYQVLDWTYTAGAMDLPNASLKRKLAKVPRKLFFGVNRDLAVRVLGGYSVLALAR